MTGKRQMLHPFSKRARRIIQGTIGCSASFLVPSKIVGQILFEATSGQVKEKVIWNSQCGFTMVKSCFSNFIALWDEMKRSVDDGRLVDTINHYFSKYHVLSWSSSSRASLCPCWGMMAQVVGLLDGWKNSKGSSHQADQGLCEERLRELEKGQIQGDLTAACHYLQGGYQEDTWQSALCSGAWQNDGRQLA